MTKRKSKQKQKDQLEFLEYMYSLIQGGYSIKQTLVFLEDLKWIQSDYRQIVQILEDGGNISEIMKLLDYPHMIQTLICFGEESGKMTDSLHQSVLYLKQSYKLKQRVVKKLQYPLFIFIIALLFVICFRLFLFPQIMTIQSMIGGSESSVTTGIIVQLLTNIPVVFLSVLIIVSIGIGSIWYLYSKDDIRWFRIVLKLPFFGRGIQIWSQLQMALLTQIFLDQGYGLRVLFEEMQKSVYPCHIQYQAKRIYFCLNEGQTYDEALRQCKIYTTDYIKIIQRGLQNKTLNVDLLFYNQYGQRLLIKHVRKGMNTFLPIVYGMVGGLIILSYLAFILPMLDMLGTI